MCDDMYEAINTEYDKWIESEKTHFLEMLTEGSLAFKDHKQPDYLALH